MKIENITALTERVCMSRNNMRNPSCNGKNKLEIYRWKQPVVDDMKLHISKSCIIVDTNMKYHEIG
jgi:hypothetical protein